MKCPRCGLAELNHEHCVVCKLEMDSDAVEQLKLTGIKRALNRIVPKKFAASTHALWDMNLRIYLHLKIIMFVIALMTIGYVVGYLLNTQNPIFTILFVWFAVMACYEWFKSHKKKKRSAEK